MSNGTNPTDELDGLQAAIVAATTGVLTRVVAVRNRDYNGFWAGGWPLIVLRLAEFNIMRLAGGQTGVKGQDGRSANKYAIELRDRLNPRSAAGEKLGAAQSDLYALMGAIMGYFDHLPNTLLPVNGVPTVVKAGDEFRWRVIRPFQEVDGGDINVVIAGTISVIGAPRSGSAT